MDDDELLVEQPAWPGSQLRVAVVTETYPPEINGVAMTIGRMVDGLQERGHHVQLVRPQQRGADRPVASASCEQVLRPGVPLPRYAGLRMGLPAARTLFKLWMQRRPDVVHVVTEGPLGWSAVAAARKLRLALTSDFHTNFHSYSTHYGMGWLKKPISGYLRKFHNRTNLTLVPTASLQRELTYQGYHNVQVVARGVDTGLFNPGRRSPVLRAAWGLAPDQLAVIYVGRIAPEKNMPLVLKAFEAIRQARPDARLVLVGDGPSRPGLQSSLSDTIFAGMHTGAALAEHYASGDLFLFPSLTETFGNVTLEAMASGLPVVAFDYAAAGDLIRDADDGVKVPLREETRFIEAAAGLAEDDGRRQVLGARARAIALNHDWRHVNDAFVVALRQSIQRHQRVQDAHTKFLVALD
ncbi:MAG: glycosyltransferase family 1 protein [Rhodocyclaceae bacterium]